MRLYDSALIISITLGFGVFVAVFGDPRANFTDMVHDALEASEPHTISAEASLVVSWNAVTSVDSFAVIVMNAATLAPRPKGSSILTGEMKAAVVRDGDSYDDTDGDDGL